MPAPEALRQQQFAFARHLRDPEGAPPPPGIEDRRMAIYRELFYNNLQGLLAGNFPVIRKLYSDADWQGLVRAFYRDYRCSTPLFPELPREFIQYLQQRSDQGAGDAPWLVELAHYEWVELALDLLDTEPAETPHDPSGDLLSGVPVLSPLAWALAYQWPVHRISPAYRPQEAPAQPSFLLVQRETGNKVRFKELSALTFRLLQRLAELPALTGREQLLALAGEAQSPDPEAFVVQGRDMLDQLRAAGVLLGTEHH